MDVVDDQLVRDAHSPRLTQIDQIDQKLEDKATSICRGLTSMQPAPWLASRLSCCPVTERVDIVSNQATHETDTRPRERSSLGAGQGRAN